jgi:hypothetical protein
MVRLLCQWQHYRSLCFANFGYEEDFEALVQANVSLTGKIAMLKIADVSPYLREKGSTFFGPFKSETART